MSAYIIYRSTHVFKKRGVRQMQTTDHWHVVPNDDNFDSVKVAEFSEREHAETFVKAMGWAYEVNE